jgi:hypothetical protein
MTFLRAAALLPLCAASACLSSSDAESRPRSETPSGGASYSDCREYRPGERGGPDYTSLLTRSEIEKLDLRIRYPEAPIAAIDAHTAYVPRSNLLRTTFTGLVKVNRDAPSTPLRFNDVPLRGLGASSFTMMADGQPLAPSRVTCTGNSETPISVVFLVDVTGSMSPVIAAVRDSLDDFVDSARGLGLDGKIGIVTFQDTVGVNVPFGDCAGVSGPIPERSPFFAPVSLKDDAGIARLRDFIGSLHADAGNDLPENLAAAVDFAANNVIGTTATGAPNVIGDGVDDPPFTSPWPSHELDGLVVLIPITDATFHEPATRSTSLPGAWRPRPLADIVASLGSTVVSTIDPALVDAPMGPGPLPEAIDADFWAQATGGFGVDRHSLRVYGVDQDISYFDLELLVLGRGLLEIPLAPALAATCVLEAEVSAPPGEVIVDVRHTEGEVRYAMSPTVTPE